MMKCKSRVYSQARIYIIFLVVLFKTSSCEEVGGADNLMGDPSNLVVRVTMLDESSVIINASADNTVHFHFRIVDSTLPLTVNTTGTFEHTFTRSGNHNIEVKAFGSSGRFLREVVVVNVHLMQGYITPLQYEGYTLVWNDEFSVNSINPNNWVFEIGTGCPDLCGWGNDELQYYRSQNAWAERGVLIIEARRENFGGRQFTSARMKTQGRRSFQYGRIDIRAKLPVGQGMWPALWMLGDNITTVGWPRCGEIDIMEMVGGRGRENTVHGTIHWYDNGHATTGSPFTLPGGKIFADEYNVFSTIWDASSITFLVNDIPFRTIDIRASHMSEFHQPFFFIFNIAVGGRWPGSPDATTVFPQQMKVDYVRVFQRN